MSVRTLGRAPLRLHGASNSDPICSKNVPQADKSRPKLTKTAHPDLTIFSNTLDFLASTPRRNISAEKVSTQTVDPQPRRLHEHRSHIRRTQQGDRA